MSTTDREAAVQQVADVIRSTELFDGSRFGPIVSNELAQALWPLICQAREDGRRQASDAILEYRPTGLIGTHLAARLARGAQPDEKERTDGQ
jgi:hypothetical protein